MDDPHAPRRDASHMLDLPHHVLRMVAARLEDKDVAAWSQTCRDVREGVREDLADRRRTREAHAEELAALARVAMRFAMDRGAVPPGYAVTYASPWGFSVRTEHFEFCMALDYACSFAWVVGPGELKVPVVSMCPGTGRMRLHHKAPKHWAAAIRSMSARP